MLKSEHERPTVLIIHDKERGARFLEGVLRNGFRVRIVTTCQAAMGALKTDPPDLVLCDHACLHPGMGELLEELTNGSEVLVIPLIVVGAERPEEDAEMLKLIVGAVDCVPRTIAPRLLRWKVRNWIHLKREVDRLRQPFTGAKVDTRNHDRGGLEGETVSPSTLTGRRAASSPVNDYRLRNQSLDQDEPPAARSRVSRGK